MKLCRLNECDLAAELARLEGKKKVALNVAQAAEALDIVLDMLAAAGPLKAFLTIRRHRGHYEVRLNR